MVTGSVAIWDRGLIHFQVGVQFHQFRCCLLLSLERLLTVLFFREAMSPLTPSLPGSGMTDRWEGIEDARVWLATPRMVEILRAIGDELLINLVIFASIPPAEMRAALATVRTPDARWSVIEKFRFNLL